MPTYEVHFVEPLIAARVPNANGHGAEVVPSDGAAEQRAVQAELKLVVQTVKNVHRQLAENNQRQLELLGDLRQDIVDLATAIAVQVIGEVDVSKQRIQTLVDEMVAACGGADVDVYLHPADHSLIEDTTRDDPSFEAIPMHADSRLERGSCRVEGPQFGFASHWKRQVATIRQNLMEQLDG